MSFVSASRGPSLPTCEEPLDAVGEVVGRHRLREYLVESDAPESFDFVVCDQAAERDEDRPLRARQPLEPRGTCRASRDRLPLGKAALLFGRHRYGWRGRAALHWILAGTGLLVIAYVGSKFVLEVILGR